MPIGIGGRGLAVDGESIDHTAILLVMMHQRSGAVLERPELLLHQFAAVIGASLSITTGILTQSAEDRIGGTLKQDEGVHNGQGSNITRLTCVTGDTVQNEQLAVAETEAVESVQNDLAGKQKAVVLQQQPFLQHFSDKNDLLGRERGRTVPGSDGPELGAEIEMVAPLAKQPLRGEMVSERTFSRPGRTEQQ
jgi:hypothetical protein